MSPKWSIQPTRIKKPMSRSSIQARGKEAQMTKPNPPRSPPHIQSKAKTPFWDQSIWSLHFGSCQFGIYYFQLTINLIPTINALIENTIRGKQFAQLTCLILKN